jgi:hypothetical protein
MINNRPKHLLDQDDYKKLPAKPFAADFGLLPELAQGFRHRCEISKSYAR